MAEAAAGFDVRRISLMGGVAVVVVFSILFFLFRACAPGGAIARKPGYTVIYSNLELKDAANVIARLKELTIPYEIREEGRAIAVPKDKSDQARLGLAEKNLPVGGAVGWEIFDETRLGATDFDRRIQLIRAISGELSRTIHRIEGVEDVRVQVVIPETKLFAATTAPVTAAVMLRLQPGALLAPEKINGIVHLVASSVENLQPENVTVVDDSGRILSVKVAAVEVKPAPMPPPPAETPAAMATPEIIASPEAVVMTAPATLTAQSTLTAEEKILMKVEAKRDLEQELSGKAQELLNRFYPINSAIVRVTIELLPARETEIKAKELKIKKTKTIVLIDNRIDLNPGLKQATFTTIAAAIGYNKNRGDSIILQKVPFHLATPPAVSVKKTQPPRRPLITMRRVAWLGGGIIAAVILFWAFNWLKTLRPAAPEPIGNVPPAAAPSYAGERMSKLDQVKSIAMQNPERIAELLKKWLSE